MVLRVKEHHSDGVFEENIYLGNRYEVVDANYSPKKFKEIYQSFNGMLGVYAFLLPEQGITIPLRTGGIEYYVMSDKGETFDNLSPKSFSKTEKELGLLDVTENENEPMIDVGDVGSNLIFPYGCIILVRKKKKYYKCVAANAEIAVFCRIERKGKNETRTNYDDSFFVDQLVEVDFEYDVIPNVNLIQYEKEELK